MSVTLSCGCRAESQTEGILCEWDAESRECKDAVAYGCICAIHYREWNARPTEEQSLAEEITEGFKALKTLRQLQAENDELKATMRSFFEDFLNVREESDSGRVFAPITIGCCRVMMTEPLSNLLDKMRKLSGAKPPPK